MLGACTARPGARRVATATAPLVDVDGARRLAYGTDADQFGVLRVPSLPGPHPVAIVVHGGFWQAGYDFTLMTPVCQALMAEGIATWNIEYRRLGQPGGGWPGTFLDVAAAADHLATLAPTYDLDLQRVITLGHSAGGQLALWLAGRRWILDGELYHPSPLRVRGAVSLAGLADLRQAWSMGFEIVGRLMGGSPEDFPARYGTGSPAELLPLGVTQVVVYGEADRIVPAVLSADYGRTAVERGDEVRLTPLPAVGHFELIDPGTPAWSTVTERVRVVLTPAPPPAPRRRRKA